MPGLGLADPLQRPVVGSDRFLEALLGAQEVAHVVERLEMLWLTGRQVVETRDRVVDPLLPAELLGDPQLHRPLVGRVLADHLVGRDRLGAATLLLQDLALQDLGRIEGGPQTQGEVGVDQRHVLGAFLTEQAAETE